MSCNFFLKHINVMLAHKHVIFWVLLLDFEGCHELPIKIMKIQDVTDVNFLYHMHAKR